MSQVPPAPAPVPAEAPKIQIGIARTTEERERIFRFRYAVYVEEMGKKTDSYADHQRKMLFDELDETGVLFYAEQNGQLLGTLRGNTAGNSAIPEEHAKIYRLDRFAKYPPSALSFTSRLMILKEQRGSMALHMLLTHAYEHGLEQGVLFDFCNCAPCLVELYEHLGYRRYMENFIDPEVGYRIPLAMMPRDAEHMKTIRSPFWRKLRTRQDVWQPADVRPWFEQEFNLTANVQEWTLGEDENFFGYLAGKYQLADQTRPVPLLQGLSPSESGEVLHGAVLTCKKGDPLIRAGDVGKEMFVVLSGELEVLSPAGKRLALFGPGQILGEIAGLLQVKRTADVIALEQSEILVLTHDKIQKLMKLVPQVAARLLFNLAHILAERLVATTRMVGDEATAPATRS